MNRKLLNGLLVVAVAVGGAVSFTSCKDEDFKNDVLLGQLSLQAQIDAIRGVDDATFRQNLEDWLNAWTQDASGYDAENGTGFKSYDEMVAAAYEMYSIYQSIMSDTLSPEAEKYVEALYNWMFNKFIAASDWYDLIYAVAERPTSIEINQVKNPVFGTINLPIGLQTTVLATYIYDGAGNASEYDFPSGLIDQFADWSPTNYSGDRKDSKGNVYSVGVEGLQEIVQSLSADVSEPLKNFTFTEADNYGNMGGAVISINPSSNDYANADKYTVELVNSKGEAVLTSVVEEVEEGEEAPVPGLELVPYEDVLYFGYGRADEVAPMETNGLYALKANATAETYSKMMVDLDKTELKNAIKNLVDKKNLSSIGHLGEVVFNQINDKLPAYGVKISWQENISNKYVPETGEEGEGEGEGEDVPAVRADEEEDAPTTLINSVTSEYNIAAVVAHPLSYNAQLGSFIPTGKRLPMVHNPLTYYIEKVRNKLTLDLSLDVDIEPIDLIMTFNSNGHIIAYVIDSSTGLVAGATVIDYVDGKPVYETEVVNGMEVIKGSTYIMLEYTAEGVQNPDPDTFDQFIHDLLSNIQNQVNQNVIEGSLEKAISDINTQLQDVQGQVGKLADYLKDIENSRKLDYAQKLVDIYNELAEKANDFLDQPNHYLQVAMAYSSGSGPHHLSNDPYMGTRYDSSKGDGASLYMTSYTGDVVVPSFKKYVAITGKVVRNGKEITIDTTDLASINSKAGLNKVFPGQQQRVAVDLSNLNGTYRITYISVDYRGMCSMENYYINVY